MNVWIKFLYYAVNLTTRIRGNEFDKSSGRKTKIDRKEISLEDLVENKCKGVIKSSPTKDVSEESCKDVFSVLI